MYKMSKKSLAGRIIVLPVFIIILAVESVMISRFRRDYGETSYAYAHVGHLHHHKIIESNCMVVEQHRTLAAKDAYAARGGWFSGCSANVITYHKQYGEVSRQSISPEMLK